MNTIKYKDINTWKEYPTITCTKLEEGTYLFEYGRLCILQIHKAVDWEAGIRTQTLCTLPDRIKLNTDIKTNVTSEGNFVYYGYLWFINSSNGYVLTNRMSLNPRTNVVSTANDQANVKFNVKVIAGQMTFINYGS